MAKTKVKGSFWAENISCEDAKTMLREQLFKTKEALQEADDLFTCLLDTDRYAHFMLFDVAFDRADVKQIDDKIDLMIWQMPSRDSVLMLLSKMFSFGNKVVEMPPKMLNMQERLCLDYAFTRCDFIEQNVEFKEYKDEHTGIVSSEEEKLIVTLTDKGIEALRKFNTSL